MHQPSYRDPVTGDSAMPWVRLHATKDYLDMVLRLAEFPSIHQTFNFVPSLLDQLEEYLPPANKSDRFLDLSRKPAAELTEEEQRFILEWFFLANPERMIKPFPRYYDLLAKRGAHVKESDWPAAQKRFRLQDYLDLQVWFNLVWIDPWLRRQDQALLRLEAKGGQFSEEEKAYVLAKHVALTGQVIPAYREALSRGQVELTASPYYHPIMPLLCELRSARMALPGIRLPEASFRHPEDARWHLDEGLRRHAEAFGRPATGMWPPEGSVSEDFVRLAIDAKVPWVATDEEILWRTLKVAPSAANRYRPHLIRRGQGQLAIVFRDRELSDLLGFVYSQWDPQIAANDFLRRLRAIHQELQHGPPGLVSIILDGENAWEAYRDDGHEFFLALYRTLASDDRFRCVTVSEFLGQHPLTGQDSLPDLFSGSWIDANFATWIGHPEKNAAWTHLAQAREALEGLDRNAPERQAAWMSLAAAEGSDWMWWFGDTHYSAQADEFDRLFRAHLTTCYRLGGLPVPPALGQPIRQRTLEPLYAPTAPLSPTIDGRESSYYEWLYAGRLDLRQQYAAIHRGEQCLRAISYGFDDANRYLRIDLDLRALAQLAEWAIDLSFSRGVSVRLTRGQPIGLQATVQPPAEDIVLQCAMDRVIELALPNSLIPLAPGERLQLSVTLTEGGEALERYPSQGLFELLASPSDLDAQSWLV